MQTLSEAIAHTIDFPATTSVGWFYEPPDKNESGVHAITLYPEPVEIQEAGPKDGDLVFPKPNSVDILAAQKQFDEVDSVLIQFELEGLPAITLEGKYKGEAVLVFLYLQPVSNDQEDEME